MSRVTREDRIKNKYVRDTIDVALIVIGEWTSRTGHAYARPMI